MVNILDKRLIQKMVKKCTIPCLTLHFVRTKPLKQYTVLKSTTQKCLYIIYFHRCKVRRVNSSLKTSPHSLIIIIIIIFDFLFPFRCHFSFKFDTIFTLSFIKSKTTSDPSTNPRYQIFSSVQWYCRFERNVEKLIFGLKTIFHMLIVVKCIQLYVNDTWCGYHLFHFFVDNLEFI